MGSAKIEIKKIEDKSNRQVTYTKRRSGLLKKAYELSILCDIDLALISFSRSGRLSHFCSRKRVEDVLIRYLNWVDEAHEQCPIRNKESLLRTLERVRSDNDAFMGLVNPENSDASTVEGLREEVTKLTEQLSMVENQLSAFEPDPLQFTSVQELEQHEVLLASTLVRVSQRKTRLQVNNSSSCCDPSSSSFEGMQPSSAQTEMTGFPNDPNPQQQNYGQSFKSSNPQILIGENRPLMYEHLLLGSSSRTYDLKSQQHNEDYQYGKYYYS